MRDCRFSSVRSGGPVAEGRGQHPAGTPACASSIGMVRWSMPEAGRPAPRRRPPSARSSSATASARRAPGRPRARRPRWPRRSTSPRRPTGPTTTSAEAVLGDVVPRARAPGRPTPRPVPSAVGRTGGAPQGRPLAATVPLTSSTGAEGGPTGAGTSTSTDQLAVTNRGARATMPSGADHHRPAVEHQVVLAADQVEVHDRHPGLRRPRRPASTPAGPACRVEGRGVDVDHHLGAVAGRLRRRGRRRTQTSSHTVTATDHARRCGTGAGPAAPGSK